MKKQMANFNWLTNILPQNIDQNNHVGWAVGQVIWAPTMELLPDCYDQWQQVAGAPNIVMTNRGGCNIQPRHGRIWILPQTALPL